MGGLGNPGPVDTPGEQQLCFWAGSTGEGSSSQAPNAPISAHGVRGAGWAARPLFECPVTNKTVVAEEMEETAKHRGEGKAEPL